MGERTIKVRVTVDGVEQATSKIQRLDNATEKAAGTMNGLGSSMGSATSGILNLVGGLGEVTVALGALGTAAVALSGIKLAGKLQQVEMGFTTLLGSASKARDMMAKLYDLGAKTPFNTEELQGMARQMLATGTAASQVLPQLKALTDQAAALGLDTSAVGAMQRQLSQMRLKPNVQMEEINVLAEWGVDVRKLVNAATGRNMSRPEAMQYLTSQGGEKAADLLIAGMEKAFGGAADRMGTSFLAVVQNATERIRWIMAPTGKVIIGALAPAGMALQKVAEGAKWLNDVTGGGAGLIVLMGGLRIAFVYVTAVIRNAVGGLRELTAAISQLAAASTGAAARAGGAAAAAGGSAAAATAATAAAGGAAAGAANGATAAKTSGSATQAIPKYGGWQNAARMGKWREALGLIGNAAKGPLGKVKNLAGGALKGLGGFAAGYGLEQGGNAMASWQNRIENPVGRFWAGATARTLQYSGRGMQYGSIFGPLGAAAGGAVGGGIALGQSAVDLFNLARGSRPDWMNATTAAAGAGANADSRALREIAANTRATSQGVQVLGGGPRARMAQGEMDIMFARMIAAGMA